MLRGALLLAILAQVLAGSSAIPTVVTGLVLEDHTGEPQSSVVVRLFKQGSHNIMADLETGSTGRFRTPALSAGEYRVEASKPSFVSAAVQFAIPPEAPASFELVIRLVRCATIAGSVLDAQGQPLAGAIVFAMAKPADGGALLPYANKSLGATATTDDNGAFRLYDLGPSQYVLAVSYGANSSRSLQTGVSAGSGVQFYPDNAKPETFTVSGGEELRSVDFYVRASVLSSVSGKVEPASAGGKSVALTPADQPVLQAAQVFAGPDGSFMFTGIPPGSYDLRVGGPASYNGPQGAVLGGGDRVYGQIRVEVTGVDLEDLAVTVGPARKASFLLRSAEGCPATARLSLTAMEAWGADIDRALEIEAGKEKVVEELAPAKYRVNVYDLSNKCYQASPVVAHLAGDVESSTYSVALEPAGSVRGKLSGAAAAYAEYLVILVPGDAEEGSRPIRAVQPNAQGYYEFTNVQPGHYRVTALLGSDYRARWVADFANMIGVEVFNYAATDIDLPTPVDKLE
jgi:protocatechuate 3,4-dioxygenase beta subunit